MKKSLLLSVLLILCAGVITAQENKTIKEETTVKRVVTKEGDKVITSEVEATSSEKGSVIVADDGQENQYFREDSQGPDQQTKSSDEFAIDEKNRELVEAKKKQQEEELQKSIEAAKAKAEEQRKMLEAQEAERMKALEENRKKLEKRGKGIVKLQKKKKKDN